MRSKLSAALLVAAAVVTVALMLVPVALADGDPASDVLLGENVYYPFSPAVSGALQRTLNAETAAAKRAGLPIKVALIDSAPDLGVLTSLFGKPQRYADFLDQEISYRIKQPLLVVMRTGFGVQGVDRAAKLAVGSLRKPAGGQSNGLARAAITAVARLADASGHAIRGVPGIPGAASAGTSGGARLIVAALALAALTTAAALMVVGRRRRKAQRSARERGIELRA